MTTHDTTALNKSVTTDLEAILGELTASLTAAGISTPSADAEILIGHILGLSRGEVLTRAIRRTGVSLNEQDRIVEAGFRRASREPLQHITGLAPFREIELHVGPGVFIPRPETELVTQIAIDYARAAHFETPLVVDLGTGSGAIAISVACEVPAAQVTAVEASPDAFVWAKENANRIAPGRVEMVFDQLAGTLADRDETFHVVVSNPPYIPIGAVPRDPEVHLFDPPMALYGGEDGCDVIREVSITGLRLLIDGAPVIIEHGEIQGEQIREILRSDGWLSVATVKDFAGRDRITTAVRPRRTIRRNTRQENVQ